MNTCSTHNPNYYHVDSDLDLSSVESFYWSLSMISMMDDTIYDCDVLDCDHEFCIPTDVFNINRVDRLLFPELENTSQVYIWNSEYTGIGHSLIDDLNPMPVYALGL